MKEYDTRESVIYLHNELRYYSPFYRKSPELCAKMIFPKVPSMTAFQSLYPPYETFEKLLCIHRVVSGENDNFSLALSKSKTPRVHQFKN